jgi:hypothetical protein
LTEKSFVWRDIQDLLLLEEEEKEEEEEEKEKDCGEGRCVHFHEQLKRDTATMVHDRSYLPLLLGSHARVLMEGDTRQLTPRTEEGADKKRPDVAHRKEKKEATQEQVDLAPVARVDSSTSVN